MGHRPGYYEDNKKKLQAQERARYLANREKRIAQTKAWKEANPEKAKEYDRQCYQRNRAERIRKATELNAANRPRANEIHRKSQKKHQSRHNASTALYRALKLQASPPWLTKEHKRQIALFYARCPKGYHVDHKVPLQGENVSGLHVLWNLQYLPAIENLKKSNRF